MLLNSLHYVFIHYSDRFLFFFLSHDTSICKINFIHCRSKGIKLSILGTTMPHFPSECYWNTANAWTKSGNNVNRNINFIWIRRSLLQFKYSLTNILSTLFTGKTNVSYYSLCITIVRVLTKLQTPPPLNQSATDAGPFTSLLPLNNRLTAGYLAARSPLNINPAPKSVDQIRHRAHRLLTNQRAEGRMSRRWSGRALTNGRPSLTQARKGRGKGRGVRVMVAWRHDSLPLEMSHFFSNKRHKSSILGILYKRKPLKATLQNKPVKVTWRYDVDCHQHCAASIHRC